jgi:hypothetical protein
MADGSEATVAFSCLASLASFVSADVGAGALFSPSAIRDPRSAVFDPLSASISRITLPFDTRSPFFTATDFTRPAAEAGTSIVAFSVSIVIKGVSSATVSPGFTSTSMTSTSLKSPMSGTEIWGMAIGQPGQLGRWQNKGR